MKLEWANPWNAEGEWLLGGLHTHTTRSDGSLPVDFTAGVYRNCDYDFLAISDHDVLFEKEELRDDGLLLLGNCMETTLLAGRMEMLVLGVKTAPDRVAGDDTVP